jgi:membrane-bound lytic murein transglycosylase B
MRKTRPTLIAAVLAAATIGGAAAQNAREDRYPATTGTIPPGAVGAQSGAQEWTGESGASGHPLMTAEAIRQAAANFRGCIEHL